MKYIRKIAILMAIVVIVAPAVAAKGADKPQTIKQERNYINDGNKLYDQQRFADAEVLYRKALEVKPTSEYAAYNLATTLIRQSGSKDLNGGNNPLQEAQSLLQNILETGKDINVVERASFNLGNIAFNNNDFKNAIEFYKNALRKNPLNDKARENLRLAQKKQQEQQNQDQNQDNKQDQQNQDQQQQQQQNKNQQNQDQNNQQNQDKQKEQDKKQQPQEQNGISDSNAEKILKAMESEEAATRKKIEAQRKKMDQANRRQPLKPW